MDIFFYGDYQKFLLSLGAIVGGSFSFLVGGIDTPITWLIVLCIIDYITGIITALITGKWCSNTGFKGIAKKMLMFVIVAMAVGLDNIFKIDTFRDVTIFAYTLNESGSILENIDRAGFGAIIPKPIRNGIKALKERNKCE